MKYCLLRGRAFALATAIAGLAAAPAHAAQAAAPDTSSCSALSISQPFTAWKDDRYYTLLPGESYDNFAGAGWTLTAGARIDSGRTLADGVSGSVLDMPAGSKAISPQVCVEEGEPYAKTMIRNLAGNSDSVSFTPYDYTAGVQRGTMGLKGSAAWSLTAPVNVLPGAFIGWHVMQFTYVASERAGDEFQLYNFAIDPRMR